jgi:hypothetical protein
MELTEKMYEEFFRRLKKCLYNNITNPMNNKNKNKTNARAVCNDGVERVLYESDKGSLFIKRKGNDGRMMFVPFSKPTNVKNVKNQNGGWGFGMCKGESCNVANATQIRQQQKQPQVKDYPPLKWPEMQQQKKKPQVKVYPQMKWPTWRDE